MPTITSEIIIQAPLLEVWEIAQDVENLPAVMPDLDEVKILEDEKTSPATRRTVTQWAGRIKQFNRKISWTEEDIWNYETFSCHFWQIKGDFDDYKGEYKFTREGSGTRVQIELQYLFNVPLLGALMTKVVQKLMQENSDSHLAALKQRCETKQS
jgi:uncharacterized membrane protein